MTADLHASWQYIVKKGVTYVARVLIRTTRKWWRVADIRFRLQQPTLQSTYLQQKNISNSLNLIRNKDGNFESKICNSTHNIYTKYSRKKYEQNNKKVYLRIKIASYARRTVTTVYKRADISPTILTHLMMTKHAETCCVKHDGVLELFM
jgi:hypothetical protein